MNPIVNPLSFQSAKIGNATEQAQFLFKLAQYLSQVQTTLNAVQAATGGQTQDLGTISTTTVVNANSALVVAVAFSFSVAVQITFNNLAVGSVVFLNAHNTAGGARTLTLAANTPGNAAYASILVNEYNNQQNLISGWSMPVGTFFLIGVTRTGGTGPALNFVGQ